MHKIMINTSHGDGGVRKIWEDKKLSNNFEILDGLPWSYMCDSCQSEWES